MNGILVSILLFLSTPHPHPPQGKLIRSFKIDGDKKLQVHYFEAHPYRSKRLIPRHIPIKSPETDNGRCLYNVSLIERGTRSHLRTYEESYSKYDGLTFEPPFHIVSVHIEGTKIFILFSSETTLHLETFVPRYTGGFRTSGSSYLGRIRGPKAAWSKEGDTLKLTIVDWKGRKSVFEGFSDGKWKSIDSAPSNIEVRGNIGESGWMQEKAYFEDRYN